MIPAFGRISDSDKRKWIMRANLTTVLLISAIIQVSASSFAQKITLSERNAPLLKVFRQIRVQTGYDFMVTATTLKGTKDITIEVKNAELNEVLKKIFEGQPLKYFVNDQTIIVSEKELTNRKQVDKDIRVSGQVVDEKGKGMPGATIKVKGDESTTPVVTSSEGHFSIVVSGENAVLIISYIGYKTKEVNISGADVELMIKMEVATGELEGVTIVSTGYQDIPKERSTGSFEKVNNALLNRNTGGNILSRLENVTPGMLIDRRLNPSRAPGIENVTIRGLSTLTQGIEKPLLVLDNFPYEGDIDNINPNDIESITVLKDAAAASIWGARAANGVIVITTRKGKYNQTAGISFNSNVTIQEKPDLFAYKTISSSDHIDLEKSLFQQGFYDSMIDDIYTQPYISPVVQLMLKARGPEATLSQAEADAQIDIFRKYDARDDYMKYVYRSSVGQQYALNINGGGNQFSYQLSGGYDKNRYEIVKSESDRITLRIAFTYKPIQKLELEGGTMYTQKKDGLIGNNSNINYLPESVLPYTRLADENGNPLDVGREISTRFLDNADPRYLDWKYRPLTELNASSKTFKTYDWLMNFGAKYELSKVFNASVRYQYTRTLGEFRNWEGPNSYYTRNYINLLTHFNGTEMIRNLPLGAILNQSSENGNSYNIRGQLNANKTWGIDHQFDALAGVEQSERVNRSHSSTVYGYNDELLTHAEVDNRTEFETPLFSFITMPSGISFSDQRYRFISYFANAAYTYKQRYTLTASGRKDAANLFGVTTNLRGAPFWSAGLSWNVSKESFYKFSMLPDLKFRATYGYQGNTNSRLSAYSTIGYAPFNDFSINLPYAVIVNPSNDDLRWERVRTLNLGIDFSSKGRLISGSIEYYTRSAKDVLNSTPLDFTTGFNDAVYNSSSLKGKGVDVSLHTMNLSEALKWNTDFFFNYNTNKVTKYKPINNDINGYLGSVLSIPSGLMVGKPVLAVFSYAWAGLDSETGDPMGYINGERSKDYVALTSVSPEQLIYHGSAAPIYSGAIRNTFTFKNISISANITGKFGHVFRRNGIDYRSLLSTTSTGIRVGHSDYALRWQKKGDENFTSIPSFIYPNDPLRDQFYIGSAALITKADHIRLQDIIVSYTFIRPGQALQNLKVFVNASNLGILWRANKLGLDPEYYLGYPAPHTIALGLNANF